MHKVDPAKDHEPLGHGDGASSARGHCDPAGHWMHALRDEDPGPKVYVPLAHGMQVVAPASIEKLPRAHGWHSRTLMSNQCPGLHASGVHEEPSAPHLDPASM